MRGAILVSVLLVLAAACIALAAALVVYRRRLAAVTEHLKDMATTEKSAVRQLRLASHNLRAIGMTLQGHAEYLEAGGELDIAGIANSATGAFDIADYMHEWAQHAQSPHTLDDDLLDLGNELDAAISAVTRSIRPGRRTWHVDPEVIAVQLRGDRRALGHVLMRVLGVAVRSSGHGDSIDVGLDRRQLVGAKPAIALLIEPRSRSGKSRNSVQVGRPDLRLTLARALMEAHGGRLEIDHAKGIGIRIAFPADRVVGRAGELRTSPTPAIPSSENNDRIEGAYLT